MDKVIISSAAERDYVESLVWYVNRIVQAALGFEAAINAAL